MNIIVMDAETFFSDEFTLKKLTTEAYIRDPQFELLMWGIYDTASGVKVWLDHVPFIEWIHTVNWKNTAVLAHHANFDGLILSHHYGIKPAMWLDTLSMARLMIGNHLSVSLANLAEHFGLDAKNVPYDKFKGKRWVDIGPELREELGVGCLHDIELTWQIFCKLMRGER